MAAAQESSQKFPSIAGLPQLIIELLPRPPTKHRCALRESIRNRGKNSGKTIAIQVGELLTVVNPGRKGRCGWP